MLRAIETVYNGYRFRSRLEARWAVFFDTLSIKYEYEKEGYDLDGTWYLPDFWLPEQKCWFEVKGQFPTNGEIDKIFTLAECSNAKAYMAIGEIKMPIENDLQKALKGEWTWIFGHVPLDISRSDNWAKDGCPQRLLPFNAWTECPHCLRIDIALNGYTSNLNCSCHKEIEDKIIEEHKLSAPIMKRFLRIRQSIPGQASNHLIEAYIAARSARFEHGENGR